MADTPQASLSFLGKFTVLKGAARELWLVFAVKLLVIAAYAVTNWTLSLWLSSGLGYSDQKALGLVAGWGVVMIITTVLVGSFTDAVGLRRTFFLGVWICIIARVVMIFTNLKWLALVGGLAPLAVGEALSAPVSVAAIRRFSNTRQRSISFSIFYMMMNFGFLVASFIGDFVRHGLGKERHLVLLGLKLTTGQGHLALPLFHLNITTYQTLFLVSLVFEILLLPILWFLREGAEATDEGLKINPRPDRHPKGTLWSSMRLMVRNSLNDTIRLFTGLLRQTGFYRLLAFLVLIGFMKLIYMQLSYVYPMFVVRELGNNAPYLWIWTINTILVIFLVPIVGALTQRFSAYKMVTLGAIISAASVFIMALPTAWFEPLATGFAGHWLGHGYLGLQGAVHPYYVMIALFVALLSVGEAFCSPRVYEYAAAIAPKGQEASYSALSYLPFLLAKILFGTFSGMLLAKYCPEVGVRHSGTLWLIVALSVTIAPIGLIFLRKYARVHEAGRED